MSIEQKYWFPAKRFGWGWGLPSGWQGWLVLVAFFALLIVGVLALLPVHGVAIFLAYSSVLSAILVAVCWIKGEPPRWRWGSR
jgi:hypothetical protein